MERICVRICDCTAAEVPGIGNILFSVGSTAMETEAEMNMALQVEKDNVCKWHRRLHLEEY